MNKPKAQGTAFESRLVQVAQENGMLADRMPEGGMRDAGDVWIGDVPGRNTYDIPIVAWSRLVKGNHQRREPDGERYVVVMSIDDFMLIAPHAVANNVAFMAECKATERLNVTRTLHQAQQKLRRWKER